MYRKIKKNEKIEINEGERAILRLKSMRHLNIHLLTGI